MKIHDFLKSRIGKNSIFSVLDQILSIGMNMFLAILFAKYLGPYSLGQYSLGISLVGVIAIISNFGIVPIFKREIAKSPSKVNLYLGNALGIKIYISFPFLLIITMIIAYILNYSYDSTYIVFLIVIYNSILSLISYIGSAFTSLHRNDLLLKINVINKSISLVLATILLPIGIKLNIILICYIFIAFIVLLYTMFHLRLLYPKFKIKFDWKFNKIYIYVSLPLVLASAAEFINLKIDTVLIGSLLNETSIGFYSAAYSVFMGATFIPLALTKVFFPNFVELIKTNRKEAFQLLNKYSLYFTLYSITIGFVFYFFSNTIIYILYNDDFYSSIKVLQSLSIALIAIVLNRLYNYTLIALKEDKYYLYITVFGSFINIISNLIFIPIYGIISASFTTFITELIIFLLAYIKINSLKKNTTYSHLLDINE